MDLKTVIIKIIVRTYVRFHLQLNRFGFKRKCYICSRSFNHFAKYKGGYRKVPEWWLKFETIGSDFDNWKCMYCGSNDRERHLFIFFDKLDLWSRFKNSNILHFAPEKNLSKKIQECFPSSYIMADLNPSNNQIKRIDVIDVPFEDNYFDIIICNHVLEHVPDYMKALKEIFRVLKHDGMAILQTPYSKVLKTNFEDEGINTDKLRFLFYLQEDHVRFFSENHFFKSLSDIGFVLKIVKHKDIFDIRSSHYYGVNENEDLIRVLKP